MASARGRTSGIVADVLREGRDRGDEEGRGARQGGENTGRRQAFSRLLPGLFEVVLLELVVQCGTGDAETPCGFTLVVTRLAQGGDDGATLEVFQ